MERRTLAGMLATELSGDRALETATEITRYYRSPGASGYHRATDYVAERFRTSGLDRVWVERYPLDGETKMLSQSMPLAWEPISAELRVDSPAGKLLTSYEDAPSCLPWWTPATPEEGVVVEVVDVGTGERPEDYEGIDLRGKAALIRSSVRPNGFAHAANLAMERGAAGIITDYLLYQTAPFRTRESLPDPVQLLRMPSNRPSAWAFAVNYHAGETLAALAREGRAVVWARIDARTFAGEAQNLFAEITGTDRAEESVLFVSHSTAGTKPGANCAAGPALQVEIARTIAELIAEGRVPRPRRSIRFLINVEGHGTKHYIHHHRQDADRTIAAIALDSVGHDQRKLVSALLYYHSPDSVPTFVNDYFVGLIESAPRETRWVFSTDDVIPLVNLIDLPYTPWSDNKYYPAFGIPAPLFMSWPDLYFHTDYLSADNLDPMVFRRCGLVNALAALELAGAGPADAQAIMREVGIRSQLRLSRIALEGRGNARVGHVRRRVQILGARDQAAVASTLNLTSSGERQQHPELKATQEQVQREVQERVEQVLGWLPESEPQEEYAPGTVVPRRLVERDAPGLAGTDYPTLVAMSEEMHARDPRMKFDSLRIIGDEVWNFIDGRRSVNDIAEAIGAEFDFDLEPRHILRLFQGLEAQGYVALGAAES